VTGWRSDARPWRIALIVAGGLLLSLQGCALATIPLNAAATTSVVDRQNRATTQIAQMNCSQLRARWAELERNRLGRFNPLGTWGQERAAIRAMLIDRRCRLPEGGS